MTGGRFPFRQIQRIDDARVDQASVAEGRAGQRARRALRLQDQAVPGLVRLRGGPALGPQVERGDDSLNSQSIPLLQ